MFCYVPSWSFANRNRHAYRFRDQETNWEYVRCLANGEAVSVDGTHLGHNLPDGRGSRYCINLVSVRDSSDAAFDKNRWLTNCARQSFCRSLEIPTRNKSFLECTLLPSHVAKQSHC